MGKTAVFNQIVLYLETPNLDQNRPFGAKLTPSRKGAPTSGPPLVKNSAAPSIPRHFEFLTRSGADLKSLEIVDSSPIPIVLGRDSANCKKSLCSLLNFYSLSLCDLVS